MPKHSKIAINNMALQEVGGNAITTFDASDDSTEADLSRAFYEFCLDEVFEAHTWDFAKEWKALALDSNYSMVDEKYEFAYALPGDYVRMSRLENKAIQYEIRGAFILTNEEDLKIEYIKKIDDTTLYPVHFVRALIARLKASYNGPLSKKGAKTIDFMSIYETVTLPNSKLRDSQGGNPSEEDKKRHVDSTDSWLTSRS